MELALTALNKNKKEIIPNTIFIGILFLISRYTFVGKFGFWIFAVLVVFQVIRYLVTLGAGTALLFSNTESKEIKIINWKTTFYMTLELAIDFVFLIPLYNHLY